jgi:hypothetical protein
VPGDNVTDTPEAIVIGPTDIAEQPEVIVYDVEIVCVVSTIGTPGFKASLVLLPIIPF